MTFFKYLQFLTRFVPLIVAFCFTGVRADSALPQDRPQARFVLNGTEEIDDDLFLLRTSQPGVALAWEVAGETPVEASVFEVQWSRQGDFPEGVTWYRGRDRASFVAGLAEGDYFFRVRVESEAHGPGLWSPTLHVRVEYQSLRLAWTLFGIGKVVFLATVFLIVAGNARSQRESRENG